MKKTENKYWLYLEPYSFVFDGVNGAIVYNTLNGNVIDIPMDASMQSVVDGLQYVTNGYCVPIESSCLERQETLAFLRKLRNTFSGDIIKNVNCKPFIIPPVCHIIENRERMQKGTESSSRRFIMNNLSEISLFLSSDNASHSSCSKYRYACQHLQYIPFMGESLTYSYYHKLLQSTKYLKLGVINILCENINTYKYWNPLCQDLKGLDVKKVFYMEYSDKICFDSINKLQIDNNSSIKINIYPPYNEEPLMKCIGELENKGLRIEWIFGVQSENDLNWVNAIISSVDIDFSVHPLLSEGNIDFFEKYVYNNYEDIIEYPISKQTIFRRQTLNENFFGKLFVLPSGEVYANLNCKPLGNIKENSLNEMVYKEMTDSTAWFMTRDRGICKDCVYRYLCPSISNYELVSGKMNMCHVYK